MSESKENFIGFVTVVAAFSIILNLVTFYNMLSSWRRLHLKEPVVATSGFFKGCKGFIGPEAGGDDYGNETFWGRIKIVHAECQPLPYRDPIGYEYIWIKPSELQPVYGPAGLGR